jgi:GT2 family glycosyltransferase
MKVIAILTCHNRRRLTLRCLETFFAQSFHGPALELEAVVVDDGSVDGTAAAVRAAFESVQVVEGDGTLFWAGGMQVAEAAAFERRPDYLLWLNDDVMLAPDALERMLDSVTEHPNAIIVGALVDPETGEVTYSGRLRSAWHPLRTQLVGPADRVREADTFNGNVVLVPQVVFRSLESIDGAFSHSQADFDYGLRARAAGFRVLVAPGTVGACRREHFRGTFNDRSLSLQRRWELMRRPTGLPMRSHARFLRRHGGPLWPIFWLAPYAKLLVSGLADAALRLRPRRRPA